jgi:hypothetical protein
LEVTAEKQGVQELYRHAVANLGRYFQKHTTRSAIGFTAVFNGSRKTVVSLIQQESNSSEGLRFQVYSRRLRTLLNLPENASEPLFYYSVFPSVILSKPKDLRGAMRPLAVLQSSALWLSRTLIGNLL